jgi:hypothetical protein
MPGRNSPLTQIIVFVNDVQRNLLGNRAQRRRFHSAKNRDHFSASQSQGCFRRAIVHQHFGFVDQLLDAGTAGAGDLADEELVQPLAGIFDCRNQSFGECLHAPRN